MKYQILLCGRNNTVTDDFFLLLEDSFETVTTSERYDDIVNHIKLCNPAAFVMGLGGEPREIVTRMGAVKRELNKRDIPFVLIGTEEECAGFSGIAPGVSDITLIKPITALEIQGEIIKLIEEKKRWKKDVEDMKRQLEELKHKREKASVKKHILIVDDDPLMLKLMKEYLHEQYNVATAINGKIALKFLEKKHTDLILLDYEMPVEDGPAVLEKLRENDRTKDIPVVFLTGITDSQKIKKVLVMKPQGYLLKPIEREKLLESIEKIFNAQE